MSEKAIVVNGKSFTPNEYSAKFVMDLTLIVREIRKHYVLGSDEMKGRRFNDDTDIILRIRSHATEAEARQAPLSWAHAALQDAASCDLFYMTEKRYADENIAEREHARLHQDHGGEG